MERRALIGMALMLVVILSYYVLFPTPKTPQEAPPSVPPAGPTGATAPAESGLVDGQTGMAVGREDILAASLLEAGFEVAEGAAREVIVETPLYVGRFTTRGGVLTSLQLKGYPSIENTPVEIVPAGSAQPLGVVLLTTTGGRIDLSGAAFSPSSESITLGAGAESSLTFVLRAGAGPSVTKTFRFRGDAYTIETQIAVSGPGSENVRAIEFGWQSGLATTEANVRDDLNNFAAITLTDQGLIKNNLGKVQKNKQGSVGGAVAWTGIRSKYFLVCLVPLGPTPVIAKSFMGTAESIGITLESDLDTGKPLECMVYVGPLDYRALKGLGRGLDKAVDFGWKWIGPLSKLIYLFLVWFYRAIPNYGWVIIVLSALIKLAFHPLTHKSMTSMRDMQKLQPEIKALREKYKTEPQKMNAAMMELYRKRGINPLGGCLPLLLQMPVFFALFNVLSKTIELRRAGFIFWIDDLSAPDEVAKLPFSLPFIGSTVSLLPILMGIAMFIQQKMTPTDPKQAMMTYLLPIIFTFMFFKFPSGLVLYWLVNNVLSIIHQYLMNRADRLKQVAAVGA